MRQATAVVMHPTDYWEMVAETLGTSAVRAAGRSIPRRARPAPHPRDDPLGPPVYRCAELAAGTALVADWTAFEIYLGSEYRIDVSSEAGNRWDQNITGFRG